MQLSIYCVLSARHISGLHAHLQEQWMLNLFTYAAYGVLGVVGVGLEECVCWWCVATSTHTPQDRHLTTPRTPYAVYVNKFNIHCS